MSAGTLQVVEQYQVYSCAKCGVSFAVTDAYERRRREDHTNFYCPNGHGQSFAEKTEAERQRERAERLQAQLTRREHDLQNERKHHSATKGQLTKTRKRTANGVCPCCNRTFANVGRHMSNKHPDFVESTK